VSSTQVRAGAIGGGSKSYRRGRLNYMRGHRLRGREDRLVRGVYLMSSKPVHSAVSFLQGNPAKQDKE
jgi:hypothetical protein